MVERLQDRIFADGVAIFEHPLNFADPYGDAGKLGGVGIDFDAQHIGGRAFDGNLPMQPQGFGFNVGAVFEVF